MKQVKILLAFIFATMAGMVTAQSTANTTTRAAQFETAAKANGYNNAYKFVISTQNPDGQATFFENYAGIGVVYYTANFKGSQSGQYCFLVTTDGAQFGVNHVKSMVNQQGFQNVKVDKMQP